MAGTVHTNRFRMRLIESFYRSGATLYLALCTDAQVPTEDVNTLADLTQIAVGNGYSSGGIALTANATDFPTITEDDANDLALVTMRNVSFDAVGGSIPSSGDPASFAVLTGSGGTVSAREVLATWNIEDESGNGYAVSSTQSLLLNALTQRIKKSA